MAQLSYLASDNIITTSRNTFNISTMNNLTIGTLLIILTISACSDGSTERDTSDNLATPSPLNAQSNSIDVASNPQNNDTDIPTEQDNVEDYNIQTETIQADVGEISNDGESNVADDVEIPDINNDASNTVIDMTVAIELPQGCIGDVDTANKMYCVYPNDRLFIASLADGSTWWSFTLPGQNDNNEIEAVVVVGNEVVLIADISPSLDAYADEKYEISRFEQSGAFIESLSVNLTPESNAALCQDAWCAYYDNEGLLPYANQAGEQIIAQQTTTAEGELGLLFGWSRYHAYEWDTASNSELTTFEGSVVSVVALDSGNTVAERLYPLELVERMTQPVNGIITITTNSQESLLNTALMATTQPDNSATGFNGKPVSIWLSDWSSAISENPLRTIAAEVEHFKAVQGWLNGTVIDNVIDTEAFFTDSAIDLSNVDTTMDTAVTGYSEETIETNCSTSGTVTITSYTLQPPQSIGSGTEVTRNRHYQFNQCAFSLDEKPTTDALLDSLDSGSYLLHGDYLNINDGSSDRNGSFTVNKILTNAFQATYPSNTIVAITGSTENDEFIDARNFSRLLQLSNEIGHYSKTVNSIETKRWSDFNSWASLSTTKIVNSWDADVRGNVFDIVLGSQAINIQTPNTFRRISNHALSNKAYDSFEGQITISTDNGEYIQLRPISDQYLPVTREWMLVTSEVNGMSISTTVPLQSLYAPVSVEGYK